MIDIKPEIFIERMNLILIWLLISFIIYSIVVFLRTKQLFREWECLINIFIQISLATSTEIKALTSSLEVIINFCFSNMSFMVRNFFPQLYYLNYRCAWLLCDFFQNLSCFVNSTWIIISNLIIFSNQCIEARFLD